MISFKTAVLVLSIVGLSCAVPAAISGNLKPAPTAADIEIIGGFTIFRITNGKMEFLLLEKASEPGDWSPPKGHTVEDDDELPIDAAYRETREETALLPQHYNVMLGYQKYFEYETNSGDEKRVTLWPAQLTAPNQPIVISDETRDYKWADINETLSIIKKQYKQAYVDIIGTLQCHFELTAC